MKKININKVFVLTIVVITLLSSTAVFAKEGKQPRASRCASLQSIDPYPMDGEGRK